VKGYLPLGHELRLRSAGLVLRREEVGMEDMRDNAVSQGGVVSNLKCSGEPTYRRI